MTYRCSLVALSLLVLTALILFMSTRRQLQLQTNNINSELGLSSHLPHTTFAANETIFTTQTQQQGRRRQLWMHMGNYQDPSSIELRQPFGASDVHHINNNDMSESRYDLPKVTPYNYDNVFVTAPAFNRELFLLYYNPQLDEFLVYINEHKDPYESKYFSAVWNRLHTTLPTLTYALRNHFPERFQGSTSSEFIVYISTGDTPKLSCDCVIKEERLKRPNYCQNQNFAPILQFGSVYRDPWILPSVQTMPVWPHLPCFAEWQREGTICEELKLRRDVAGKLGGEEPLDESSSVWSALIPTIIWRGSDYFFLICIHPNLLPVEWDRDIKPRSESFGKSARGVVQSLLDMWNNLTPRWKGVTLTSIAKLDAEEANQQQSTVPWIDIKFTVKSKVHGHEVEPDIIRYEPFQDYGIDATSESMSLAQFSQYKYHIDIGGGGGTTWYGTAEKLGMPGVLFHHLSESKDYFHDDLKPWIHYIPINEDLSNLRKMFDWAEEHSEAARKISEAGIEYVKNQARPEVMKAKYEKYFFHTLKGVIDAYQPIQNDEAKAQVDNWLSNWSLVGKCNGHDEICDLKNWRIED